MKKKDSKKWKKKQRASERDREQESEREREAVCVYVKARERERGSVCLCEIERERERSRERKREKQVFRTKRFGKKNRAPQPGDGRRSPGNNQNQYNVGLRGNSTRVVLVTQVEICWANSILKNNHKIGLTPSLEIWSRNLLSLETKTA